MLDGVFSKKTYMRLLLFILLFSFSLSAQDSKPHYVSVSGGYEFHGTNARGWNVTANAVRQFDNVPRLNAGFNLAYGISEYNAERVHESDVIQVSPSFMSLSMSYGNYPIYSRMEHVRMGIEANYVFIEQAKYSVSAGLGVVMDALLSYRESGVRVWYEYDPVTFNETYLEQDYSFDKKTKDITGAYTFFAVPQVSFMYHVNKQLGLFVRSALFARIDQNPRYGGFLQNNLGVSYKW